MEVMDEKLLHYIWKFRLFDSCNLRSTSGEPVEIIHPGIHNPDAGADFQNAKIRIGTTTWVGNVEMHLRAEDWFSHGHHRDASYNNVVLHAVFRSGKKIATRQIGEELPTVELGDRINPSLLARFAELQKRRAWIPCQKFFRLADEITVKNFMERLMAERLESKVQVINELLMKSDNDWENVLLLLLAKYLGASINKEPFFTLAGTLPLKILSKHANDPIKIEALVLGQAGFLEEKRDDEYPNMLRREYNYLRRLHNLQPVPGHLWKFLRLRPSNFPTVRLAQYAALITREVKIFTSIRESLNAKAIFKLLDADVSEYWQTHYVFDKAVKKANTRLGDSMKNILIINAVAPVLFAYGRHTGAELYCDRALELLENSKAESNAIINGWRKLGLAPAHAGDSQAMLQLKNQYCDQFACLACAIGGKILR